jgi:hypothetical protein
LETIIQIYDKEYRASLTIYKAEHRMNSVTVKVNKYFVSFFCCKIITAPQSYSSSRLSLKLRLKKRVLFFISKTNNKNNLLENYGDG